MWTLEKWSAVAILAVVVVQALLIAALLVQRTRRRRLESAFAERLRFEGLLSKISAELLATPPGELDDALERALQRVVAFLGLDRGNVQVIQGDGQMRRISWTVEGTPVLPGDFDPATSFPWADQRLRGGGIIRFSRRDELPVEAVVDRKTFARIGTQSHISIGLWAGGRIVGSLSFGSTRPGWVCSDERTEQLGLLGEMFAGALARRNVARVLDERLRFEALLSELSATFVTLPTAEIDHAIEDAQRRISETLRFDRTTLWHIWPGSGEAVLTHSWQFPGLPPPLLLGIPTRDAYPWLLAKVLSGEAVMLSGAEDLPPEAVRDRETLGKAKIKSVAVFPLTVGGVVFGGIAFVTIRRARAWPDPLTERLRLVVQVFAHALMRKQAETTLRESEERFRLLADSAPVMMWMSDATGARQYFNQRWLDFAGLSPEKQAGDGWTAGIHPDDLVAYLDTYRRAVKERRSYTKECRLRRVDGEYRWVLDHGVSRTAPDGTYVGHIGSCIDTTDLRAAEEALRRQQEELAHALRVTTMGELAASLAHELNQPLATIVTNAQASRRLLDSESLRPDDLRGALTDIADEGLRAAQVIARLRALFRKEESKRQPVDLTELVSSVAGLLRHDVQRRNIAMELRLAPDLPEVTGDAVQLQQVVLNLLLNACEAIGAGADGPREIAIETFRAGPDRVELSVRDSGPGLEESQLERIFEPFVTTKASGLGMGLSISRSIVSAHDGRIWATRNGDRGLVMHIELPAGESPASS